MSANGEENMPRNTLRLDSFHPTIGSAYDAVGHYMEQVTAILGAGGATPPLPIQPIDGLLIHLLAGYHETRPTIVDLASASTWGVSTLLCRTTPSPRRVVTLDERPTQWQSALDEFLLDRPLPAMEFVRVDGVSNIYDKASELKAPLLVLAPVRDALNQHSSAHFENWLERQPRAVLLLIGVGQTGDCSCLESLTHRCTGGPYRVALPREAAPALVESRIALVSNRDHVDLESLLTRIGLLFANQYPFLNLVKRACNTALEQSVLNESLTGHTAGILDPQTVMTPYELRRVLMQRERESQEQRQKLHRENAELLQELQDVRQSLTFRVLQRIRRLSHLARFPHWGVRKDRRNGDSAFNEETTNSESRRAC